MKNPHTIHDQIANALPFFSDTHPYKSNLLPTPIKLSFPNADEMDDATLLSNNAAIIKNPYFIVLPNAGINNVTIKSIGMIKIIVLKIIFKQFFLHPSCIKIKKLRRNSTYYN